MPLEHAQFTVGREVKFYDPDQNKWKSGQIESADGINLVVQCKKKKRYIPLAALQVFEADHTVLYVDWNFATETLSED